MSSKTALPHLLFVVGPTACGKSDFAVEVSEQSGRPGELHAEIINCDSVQFFEGIDIGAAKPDFDLMARATHHLISHLPPGATYTAGDFRRDALRIITERTAAKVNRFIPVGGSGFYIQALEKGMFDVPDIPDEIREAVASEHQKNGLGPLHDELMRRDPVSGARIKPGDTYRILRALEILRADPDSRTLNEIKDHFERHRKSPPFEVSKIGLFRERDVLRDRVIERTRRMLRDGLIEEVKALREKGLGAWAPMQSVGYAEVQAMLDGKLNKEVLTESIVTSTMQLAKRQMTWFKRDPQIQWFDSEKGFELPLTRARAIFGRS